MDVVIREVLGHLHDPDGSVTFFVEAEIAGTVSGTCQLTFSPDATVKAFGAIVENGIRVLRHRSERPDHGPGDLRSEIPTDRRSTNRKSL